MTRRAQITSEVYTLGKAISEISIKRNEPLLLPWNYGTTKGATVPSGANAAHLPAALNASPYKHHFYIM